MDLVSIVRRYQGYDRGTRGFGRERSLSDYAAILGVHESNLSRFYAGQVQAPWAIVRGLLRFAPEACAEVCHFLSSDLPISNHE